MLVAVEGCLHGKLDTIYQTIQSIEDKHDIKIDLLLCCGDAEFARNDMDQQSVAKPQHHQTISDFRKLVEVTYH